MRRAIVRHLLIGLSLSSLAAPACSDQSHTIGGLASRGGSGIAAAGGEGGEGGAPTVGGGGSVSDGTGGSVSDGTGGSVSDGTGGSVSGGTGGACSGELTECSGSCVDLVDDNDNCGECGYECPLGLGCVDGACVCPSVTPDLCADEMPFCTDLDVDRDNCGRCGRKCDPGFVCDGTGECALSCQDELTECSGVCRDTETDPNHCGDCDEDCADGQVCEAGACSCPSLAAAGEIAVTSLETLLEGWALIPVEEGTSTATTFVSAISAFGFLLEGRDSEAEQLLDAFQGVRRSGCATCLAQSRLGDAAVPASCEDCGDPCPACTCKGGFQQFREAATGASLSTGGRNDFWIGDNAWLLAVLEYHAASRESTRYDELIFQLREWFRCLRADTTSRFGEDADGIHSGFDKDGMFRSDDPFNPEGNIDVYGALSYAGLSESDELRRADIEEFRASVKRWIEANVWIPPSSAAAGCARRGPTNVLSVPADHISWGTLALVPDDSTYACLPGVHGYATGRALDLSFIDTFDRSVDPAVDYWRPDPSTPAPVVEVRTIPPSRTLRADYDWNGQQDVFFLVVRRQGVRLSVTEDFVLRFPLRSDAQNPSGIGPQFEITLTGENGCQYWPAGRLGMEFPLNGLIELPYSTINEPTRRFVDGSTGASCAEDLADTKIKEIRFALSRASDSQLPEQGFFEIGPLTFSDEPTPGSLAGFAGIQSDEPSRIFVEGTASMATAYCAVGACREYVTYMSELAELMARTHHADGDPQGLPSEVRLGSNCGRPAAAAAGWMIIASHCFNPFDPGVR